MNDNSTTNPTQGRVRGWRIAAVFFLGLAVIALGSATYHGFSLAGALLVASIPTAFSGLCIAALLSIIYPLKGFRARRMVNSPADTEQMGESEYEGQTIWKDLPLFPSDIHRGYSLLDDD